MDYICHFFWNKLPSVKTEMRIIDGVEQPCLIIPTKINQIKKGKQGNWLSTFRLTECQVNEKMITHHVQLGYLNYEEVDKAKQHGYYEQSQYLGRVRFHDRTPSKKIDRRNFYTDVRMCGEIVLTDIPYKDIIRNAENDKRYITKLTLRSESSTNTLYTGTICIDDIPPHEIRVNAKTGKRYVNVIFCKLKYLDTYMNTHRLIISRDDGSEIEIGRFKEWKKEVDKSIETHESINNFHTPDVIGGIKY